MRLPGFAPRFPAPKYSRRFSTWPTKALSIKPQPGSRIVTVCSNAGKYGKIAFDNLQSERRYTPMFGAYTQSKLADLIFTLELQRRLTAARSPILSAAAHPGYAVTNLHDSGPGDGNSPMKIFLNLPHPLS